MTRFRNRYRVESTRLQGWDYASAGWYFVTLCTRDRTCWFGDIVDGDMCLSEAGLIVAEEWQKTAEIRPNVELDQWIVMPNHLHGILVITGEAAAAPKPLAHWSAKSIPRLQAGSLGAIIGQVKSVCTKRIRAAGYPDFAWQGRFYDHIIRDESSLSRIREYIVGNAATWEKDSLHPPL
jgi:putative transposase